MATKVLALFKQREEAEAAIRALRAAHFDPARLGIADPGDARVPRYGVAAFKACSRARSYARSSAC